MKRIIFDLDNTLIMWKDSYIEALDKTLKKYNVNIDTKEVNAIIDSYEDYYNYYDKEKMLALINKKFSINLGISFIDNWLDALKDMADIAKEDYDTLDYLSNKYELVILTNWFKESQIGRLKKVNIYKFFKEIYSGEKVIKPNKEAFLKACGPYKTEECLMIGDNYKIDIEVSSKLGIKTLLMGRDIKKISDLKEML